MKNLAAKLLSTAERELIIQAVQKAERETSAEIVPMIVSASHDYRRADLVGALSLGMGLSVAAALALHRTGMWNFLELFGAFFFLLLILIPHLPALKRVFLTSSEIETEVREAAILSFYRNNLHLTRDHTGILIYISVYERRVWVLADTGIAAVVPASAWDGIVELVGQGIRQGRTGQALSQAVERCAGIVRERFPVQPDDQDELANLIIADKPW